ncbi:unnamed protein product [Hydatigera taeniaeformis]|uniref:Uncharacterized protein n=1 Tax=Hydatigena taeniaeformis TaxID=6205 RepID=A0A0R3WPL4_HYDTA|nr:unnamed protein product [Hydatigera taeniaeformis]
MEGGLITSIYSLFNIIRQLRNSSDNPHCRSESHDSPTLSSAAVVDAVDASDYPDDLENIEIEEEEEADARFAQQPPSASHAVPLSMLSSHPRTIKEVDEAELADSLAAISGPVGRRRPTPFSLSVSSPNAYDQASESFHSPPCPDPRRRRAATDAVSVSGSCSSGGGGGGSDSLKTSAGGISATPHVAPPISAPWYQPHIPRELALDMLSRQPVSLSHHFSETTKFTQVVTTRVCHGQ